MNYYEKRIAELESEKADLMKSLEYFSSEHLKNGKELYYHKEANSILESKVNSLEASYASLEYENRQLNKKIKDLNEENRDLEERNYIQREMIEKAWKDANRIEKELESVRKENKDLTKNNDEVWEKHYADIKRIESLNNQIFDLEEQKDIFRAFADLMKRNGSGNLSILNKWHAVVEVEDPETKQIKKYFYRPFKYKCRSFVEEKK